MAWGTPPTAVNGAIIQAADANTVRDDLNETAAGKITTAGDLVYATGANALARLAIGTAQRELLVNSGATAPQWYTRPAAQARATTGVSLTTGSVVPLALEDFDTDTIHDNSTNNDRLTCKTAGRYLVYGAVTFTLDAGGGYRYVVIEKNGSAWVPGFYWPFANPNTNLTVHFTLEITLAVNDYIRMVVYHDTGGSIGIQTATWLGMSWLTS